MVSENWSSLDWTLAVDAENLHTAKPFEACPDLDSSDLLTPETCSNHLEPGPVVGQLAADVPY
jgi:hypothetical protein